MAYTEFVKRTKPHFENCNDNPEETYVKCDYNTFWPPGHCALCALPEYKKILNVTHYNALKLLFFCSSGYKKTL